MCQFPLRLKLLSPSRFLPQLGMVPTACCSFWPPWGWRGGTKQEKPCLTRHSYKMTSSSTAWHVFKTESDAFPCGQFCWFSEAFAGTARSPCLWSVAPPCSVPAWLLVWGQSTAPTPSVLASHRPSKRSSGRIQRASNQCMASLRPPVVWWALQSRDGSPLLWPVRFPRWHSTSAWAPGCRELMVCCTHGAPAPFSLGWTYWAKTYLIVLSLPKIPSFKVLPSSSLIHLCPNLA